jgi:hypothetical protein
MYACIKLLHFYAAFFCSTGGARSLNFTGIHVKEMGMVCFMIMIGRTTHTSFLHKKQDLN